MHAYRYIGIKKSSWMDKEQQGERQLNSAFSVTPGGYAWRWPLTI